MPTQTNGTDTGTTATQTGTTGSTGGIGSGTTGSTGTVAAAPIIDETRMPTHFSWGYQYYPEYRTKITELLGGTESRKGYWSKGRLTFTLKKEDVTLDEAFILESFFRARKGPLNGFRLRHPNSYKKTLEPLPLLTTTTAQLQFVYPDEIRPEIQLVTKPVRTKDINIITNPDITLQRNTGNGFSDFPTAGNWTIDRTTGLITFSSAQAAGTTFTWSGSYDWPVRMKQDLATFQRDLINGATWSDIVLVELKQG